MKLLEYALFIGLIILLRVLDFITYDTLVICVIVLGIGDRIITKIDESKVILYKELDK